MTADPVTDIPKRLHFIWMQGPQSLRKKRPEFIAYENAWRRLLGGDWTFKVWDMDSLRSVVAEVEPGCLKLLDDPEVAMSPKSDIGRHAIMYKYGGVYADVGTRPLRSIKYLLHDTSFAFIHREVTAFERTIIGHVNTSWFAATPGHIIVRHMLNIMAAAPLVKNRPSGQTVAQWVNNNTGPEAWWQAVKPHIMDNDVRAVPFEVVDPITMSNATVDPDDPDLKVMRKYPSAALIHNGRESWISAPERASLSTAKFARDNWAPILITVFVILVVCITLGGTFVWLFLWYKRRYLHHQICSGGDCPVYKAYPALHDILAPMK